MKAMVLSDLMAVKKIVVQELLIGLIAGAIIIVSTGSPTLGGSCVGAMVAFTVVMSLISVDEAAGWQRLRLAFPLSRADVVRGRYLSVGLLLVLGVVVGAVLAAAVALALPVVSTEHASGLEELEPGALALTVLALWLVMIAGMALMLPFLFRFGFIRALRFMPAVAILVVAFSAIGLEQVPLTSPAMSALAQWLDAGSNLAIVAVVATVVVIALYLASCALSISLYKKREF